MGIEARDALFQDNRVRFEQLAYRAHAKGLRLDEFVVILIDVDDSYWNPVVEEFMPGQNWQAFRDRGEKPMARGTVLADFSDFICTVCPDVADALRSELPEGEVRVIIMSYGVSVYLVQPILEQ